MPAQLIDGKAIAQDILAALAPRVTAVAAARGAPPGLAAVLVGDDPASATYVKMKSRRAQEVGVAAVTHRLPATTAEGDLLALVTRLAADPRIDGILVQRPLPPGIDVPRVGAAIDPRKDVDGFHPANVGALVLGQPGPRPCTPLGVMELLRRSGVALAGSRAVVVGRSDIVGKPTALLLLHAHATVTICHTRTRDLAAEVGRAEVLVVAAGRPGIVAGDWVREGAVVIDVGVNRLADGTLTGDVDFVAAAQRAAAITPVPGGVGPMTIAMLLANTVAAAEASMVPAVARMSA
jgi:methylenetetrahydrofolate dehydrogenase (NADP+)/methenyltetrahydrofolate cyclohydrolase